MTPCYTANYVAPEVSIIKSISVLRFLELRIEVIVSIENPLKRK